MASLKRTARKCASKVEGKEDTCTDGVLELSVTVSYLAADVSKEEIGKLERLLHDHCNAGLVAMERGDLEQHLHFQMVCRARVKSSRAFGILVRTKYMGWYGLKSMNPVGKVMCKVLTNRLIHTWKGMLGYCLKDSRTVHFDVAMFNISDDDVVAGKTLHTIYDKADLKSRVVITNKNVGERAYVWFKYREKRQLHATFLSTLTDMIRSAAFIPAASWIIPYAGQGMDNRRVCSFWKCFTDPCNVEQGDVADVFIRKREYVRGRYWYDENPSSGNANGEQYEFNAAANIVKEEPVSSPLTFPSVRVLPRVLDVPPMSGMTPVRVSEPPIARNVLITCQKKLFDDVPYVTRPVKPFSFSDLGDFVPLQDIAPLPVDICLPSMNVGGVHVKNEPMDDAHFWDSLTKHRSVLAEHETTKKSSTVDCTAGREPDIIVLSSDSEDETSVVPKQRPDCAADAARLIDRIFELEEAERQIAAEKSNPNEVILISSDSEDDEVPRSKHVKRARCYVDRKSSLETPPLYARVHNVVGISHGEVPPSRPWRVEDPSRY